ncbi:hypothetical protein EV426DRAFT_574651 [Tirmania nivea]|nr:hypothetical protein EV426DRAFT_574651 [Tirmania nivea]
MSGDGNGATAIGERLQGLAQPRGTLDTSEISFKATGLKKQQYNSLALLWVEVWHIIVITLGKLELESIDVGTPRRAKWVEGQMGWDVDNFDMAKIQGNVDHLNVPLSRWDQCRDTQNKPIKQKYATGEVGLWARFSSAPNLGNNDTERKVDKEPQDAFQWWKQYLYMCEDMDLMDFDFMFAQFFQGEYSNLHDQQYCMKVHSRAAYLTRYWDHEEESKDQELKRVIDHLLALSFELPIGFMLSLDDVNYQPPPVPPPVGALGPPRLVIEGLQGL